MAKISDILDESRSSFLNDPNAATYSNAIMLPKIKTAYNLMETKLIEHKIQCKNHEYTKVITAGDTELTLPNDLVIPHRMSERNPNTTDEWVPMTLVPNLTSGGTIGSFLVEWTWRLDRIFFREANQDREIFLIYSGLFPAINTADDTVFGKAEQYLAAKTAALIYMFVEQSPQLAETANEVAEAELASIINVQTKIMQAIPVRRKPYRPFRRR